VHVDVLADSRFPFFYTAEHAPSNSLVGEFGEPALHQVDPGSVGGSEVDMKAWAFGKPFPNKGRFVGSVVVHNDMHLECSGHLRLDQIEELAKFQRAMAGLELRHHLAGL